MCLTSVIHKDNVFQILVILSHVIITNLAIDSMWQKVIEWDIQIEFME